MDRITLLYGVIFNATDCYLTSQDTLIATFSKYVLAQKYVDYNTSYRSSRENGQLKRGKFYRLLERFDDYLIISGNVPNDPTPREN